MSIALAIALIGLVLIIAGLLGRAMERFVSYQGRRRADRFQAEANDWSARMERVGVRRPRQGTTA